MSTRIRDARLPNISSKVVFSKRFFSKPPATPSLVVHRLTIIAALLMIICVLTVVATVHAVRVSGENKKPTNRGGLTPGATSQGPRQSSPVALAPNNQTLVNVNPEANTVTVFDVSSDSPSNLAEILVGRDPSSVAIHPDGNLAYVANSFDGTVSIVNLASLSVGTTFGAGTEPMAVALSPNGTRLYVANWASNTLGVYNTAGNPPTLVATIDLSSFGTAPRAIGITNDDDGDDTDETIFVALFFGQLRPGKGAVDEGQDDQREGRVVAISAATNTVLGAPNPTVLGRIANAGFNSNGRLAPGPAQSRMSRPPIRKRSRRRPAPSPISWQPSRFSRTSRELTS